jgi:hypothetical protein
LPVSIKSFKKRAGGVAQGIGPEFKPHYHKKKEKKKVIGIKFVDSYRMDNNYILSKIPSIEVFKFNLVYTFLITRDT